MPGPFKGVIELDIHDSTPDWDAFLPDKAPFEFTGGTIVKVVYDVADDAYVDVERELGAALARD